MQGHFRLARVGGPVAGFLDVHAAARGLILDPALRHTVARGGACGRVLHSGQCPVVGGGPGTLPGVPAPSRAVPQFPGGAEGVQAARSRRGSRGAPPAGSCGSSSRSESVSSSTKGGVLAAASKSPHPDDFVCHVQRRRILRGDVGSAIAVSLCLRAERGTDLLWLSCACGSPFCGMCCGCGGVWVGEPDVGFASHTFDGWCPALLPGPR